MGGIKKCNRHVKKMGKGIRKVANETLGESRGFGPKGKETWLWDAIVQNKAEIKRECYKA